jgi:hypothetical protein
MAQSTPVTTRVLGPAGLGIERVRKHLRVGQRCRPTQFPFASLSFRERTVHGGFQRSRPHNRRYRTRNPRCSFQLDCWGLDYSAQGISVGSNASLTRTGFSVYDASGNLVPGAQVTPVLTFEPGAFSLLLCDALVFYGAVHVAHRRAPVRGRPRAC